MAKQSLDKLLEEIIKNVHKTSATYRNFTSNKRIHGITVNATDIASVISVTNKKLIKAIDILGRKTDEKKNTLLFYIYNDGTVEKRIVIE